MEGAGDQAPVVVHDLVMPQEDDGPDREELLTERNALVDRVKELSPLLRDIHQPVLEITAAINDVKARIDEIDAELLDRSVSAAAKLAPGGGGDPFQDVLLALAGEHRGRTGRSDGGG